MSNASFASLSLIYSLTEMLDLAEQVSSMAALTARVIGLLEELQNGSSGSIDTSTAATTTTTTMLHERAMLPSVLATKLYGPTALSFSLPPPINTSHPPYNTSSTTIPMEVSIHALGDDIHAEALKIFPDLLLSPSQGVHGVKGPPLHPLLCVMTFQCAGGGTIDLSPDRSSATLSVAAAEMDRLLDCFLRWEAVVGEYVRRSGPYWCDAIDPRTYVSFFTFSSLCCE